MIGLVRRTGTLRAASNRQTSPIAYVVVKWLTPVKSGTIDNHQPKIGLQHSSKWILALNITFPGNVVCFFSWILLSAVGLNSDSSLPAAEPPDIILLMGDDHGWDETGYNGHPFLKTPVLDEMAASGLRFDRFYSAHPSCSPTRGSIITGRHPNRYGTFSPNCSIRPEEISIAHIMSKAGYACGHFGKWHLGPVKKDSPTNPGAMGFDEWLSHDNFFELNPVLSRNGSKPTQFQGESSEILIRHAIKFIQNAKRKGKPTFTVIWFGSPHEPYSGLADDLALYAELPELLKKETVRLTSNQTGKPVTRPLNEVLQERYAEITAMDRAIGQLRNWLVAHELKHNTLLWYCGDNGSPAGASVTSPLRGRKGTMYEGGIRVPGLIEWPATIRKPRVSNVNAVTTDMLATLLELIGQDLPDRPMDGISLLGCFDGKMASRAEPICFWSFPSGQSSQQTPYIDQKLQQGTTPLVKMMAGRYTRNFRNFKHPQIRDTDFGGSRVILDNRYKLIVQTTGTQTSRELYDVMDDPAEKKDLLEMMPAVADTLEKQLQQWQQSVLTSLTGGDYR